MPLYYVVIFKHNSNKCWKTEVLGRFVGCTLRLFQILSTFPTVIITNRPGIGDF